MVDKFISIYKRLLQATNYTHHRYIYKYFNTNNRLTGLVGPRGTGKTTLLLQYIKENIKDKDECIFVSVDHIFFSKNTILDFINEMYEDYGTRYFFFDEIHKYKNWNQELKNAYDSYPDIKIVFSGSSSIDLIKGAYDLSRRGVLFRIGGMSFREYLLFHEIADFEPITFDELLQNRSDLENRYAQIKKIKGYFKDYLESGYYPFYFEDEHTYYQKILRTIEKIVYEDISNYYKLKTENLFYFKKVLSFLATIPPGEVNRNSISKNIGLDIKTVENYLKILYETGLVELVAENKSGSNLLKNAEKIYLDNWDVYRAIIEDIGYSLHTGTLREIFFVKMIKNSGAHIYFSAHGDFEVNGKVFEVGGKNKDMKQIKNNVKESYIVKDDVLYGNTHEIPLYLFGFLY